jgi:putative addiction module CopG family antidote
MTIDLPEDVERYVHSQVQCGRFASPDEAIAEAVRRLRQAEQESPPARPMTEAEFKRQLLAAGLMTSLPTFADPAARPPFEPVSIEGEPVSETIIRERR